MHNPDPSFDHDRPSHEPRTSIKRGADYVSTIPVTLFPPQNLISPARSRADVTNIQPII
ncbi:hypothetical protein BDN71DRAFT_1459133 [Pleurotus eryngii]|uniref:Uncharacterized protein n=1 Tax=Pleurotus eryngii TaxID=5323 RepID=A0A9P5ZGS5_PLEER|nr:hypothetical protein BDN71DRAFT_1459133 [Pleurotus eryngii]